MNKELKALETLRQNVIDGSHQFSDELLDIIEPALKALEIIKEKNVDVQLLKNSKNFVNYNWCVRTDRVLAKEEFDLLKEVLL